MTAVDPLAEERDRHGRATCYGDIQALVEEARAVMHKRARARSARSVHASKRSQPALHQKLSLSEITLRGTHHPRTHEGGGV